MKKFLILNGPNLNLLGRRQPEIYGHTTMEDILKALETEFSGRAEFEYYQSNHEGSLIDRLQEAGYGPLHPDAIVFNAGGYTHTSVALADAVAAIPVPVAEVHLSDISAREPFRRHSYLSPVCVFTLAGLGPGVYSAAVDKFLRSDSFTKLS